MPAESAAAPRWPRTTAFSTARLRAEPLTTAHAGEMVQVLSSPELYSFTGGTAPDAAELDARYRRQAAGHSPAGDAGWLNWILREPDTGRAVGYVQATITAGPRGNTAELAWLITPAEQGRGLAAEATRGLGDWLHTSGITALRAHIHPGHHASRAVARGLGLEPTAVVVDGEVEWVSPG